MHEIKKNCSNTKKKPYLTNIHEKIECKNNNPTDFKSIKKEKKKKISYFDHF